MNRLYRWWLENVVHRFGLPESLGEPDASDEEEIPAHLERVQARDVYGRFATGHGWRCRVCRELVDRNHQVAGLACGFARVQRDELDLTPFLTDARWEIQTDPMDATVFGDTQRTYLTGARHLHGEVDFDQDGLLLLREAGAGRAYVNAVASGEAGRYYIDTVSWDTNTTQGHWELPPVWETAAQRLHRLAQEAEQQQQAVEAARRQAAEARERANALLMRFLDPRQQSRYRSHGYFAVTGSEGGRYEIHASGHVRRMNNWGNYRAPFGFCVATDYHYRVPTPDDILAKLLMIQNNEGEFLDTANPMASPIA